MQHIVENEHFKQAYLEYWEGIKCYRMGLQGRPTAQAARLRYIYRLLAGK